MDSTSYNNDYFHRYSNDNTITTTNNNNNDGSWWLWNKELENYDHDPEQSSLQQHHYYDGGSSSSTSSSSGGGSYSRQQQQQQQQETISFLSSFSYNTRTTIINDDDTVVRRAQQQQEQQPSNITMIQELVMETFYFPTYDFDAPDIVQQFAGAMRLGHSSDFSYLFGTHDQQSNYIRGLLALGILILLLFSIWGSILGLVRIHPSIYKRLNKNKSTYYYITGTSFRKVIVVPPPPSSSSAAVGVDDDNDPTAKNQDRNSQRSNNNHNHNNEMKEQNEAAAAAAATTTVDKNTIEHVHNDADDDTNSNVFVVGTSTTTTTTDGIMFEETTTNQKQNGSVGDDTGRRMVVVASIDDDDDTTPTTNNNNNNGNKNDSVDENVVKNGINCVTIVDGHDDVNSNDSDDNNNTNNNNTTTTIDNKNVTTIPIVDDVTDCVGVAATTTANSTTTTSSCCYCRCCHRIVGDEIRFLRYVFISSGIVVILFAIFLVIFGLQNLQESVYEINTGSIMVLDLTTNAYNVIQPLLPTIRTKLQSINVYLQNELQTDIFCPTYNNNTIDTNPILVNTIIPLVQTLSVRILQALYNVDVLINCGYIDGIVQSIVDVQESAQSYYNRTNSIDFMDWKAILIVLVYVCVTFPIVLCAILVLYNDHPYNKYSNIMNHTDSNGRLLPPPLRQQQQQEQLPLQQEQPQHKLEEEEHPQQQEEQEQIQHETTIDKEPPPLPTTTTTAKSSSLISSWIDTNQFQQQLHNWIVHFFFPLFIAIIIGTIFITSITIILSSSNSDFCYPQLYERASPYNPQVIRNYFFNNTDNSNNNDNNNNRTETNRNNTDTDNNNATDSNSSSTGFCPLNYIVDLDQFIVWNDIVSIINRNHSPIVPDTIDGSRSSSNRNNSSGSGSSSNSTMDDTKRDTTTTTSTSATNDTTTTTIATTPSTSTSTGVHFNPPDVTSLQVLQRNGFDVASLEFHIAFFYITQCTYEYNPIQPMIDIIAMLNQTNIDIDQMLIDFFTNQTVTDTLGSYCGRNFTELENAINETKYILLTIIDIIRDVLFLIRCDEIIPIYQTLFYNGTCQYSVQGLFWLFSCTLIISFFGCIMITIRSAYSVTKYSIVNMSGTNPNTTTAATGTTTNHHCNKTNNTTGGSSTSSNSNGAVGDATNNKSSAAANGVDGGDHTADTWDSRNLTK